MDGLKAALKVLMMAGLMVYGWVDTKAAMRADGLDGWMA